MQGVIPLLYIDYPESINHLILRAALSYVMNTDLSETISSVPNRVLVDITASFILAKEFMILISPF
jgi:hypothetical protein